MNDALEYDGARGQVVDSSRTGCDHVIQIDGRV
jgi:hypothetical protein